MSWIESRPGLNPNFFEANQGSVSREAEATYIVGFTRIEE